MSGKTGQKQPSLLLLFLTVPPSAKRSHSAFLSGNLNSRCCASLLGSTGPCQTSSSLLINGPYASDSALLLLGVGGRGGGAPSSPPPPTGPRVSSSLSLKFIGSFNSSNLFSVLAMSSYIKIFFVNCSSVNLLALTWVAISPSTGF